jgi:hypothetical protein
VYAGNLRDIAFSMSRDGLRVFTPPVRVSQDKWAIDGCPENGPTIAVDRSNRIHVAWPTLVPGSRPGADSLGLFYASSRDGRQFSPRHTIPTQGIPRHVQMVIAPDDALLLAWDEGASGQRRVIFAKGTPGTDGGLETTRQVLTTGEGGAYPAVAATRVGPVVAWTTAVPQRSVIRIERVNVH